MCVWEIYFGCKFQSDIWIKTFALSVIFQLNKYSNTYICDFLVISSAAGAYTD